MTDVGTKKVLENDALSVWEFFLEPGEQTPNHRHERDFVLYVIDGTTLQINDVDGNEVSTVDVPTGSALAFRVDGDELLFTVNPCISS